MPRYEPAFRVSRLGDYPQHLDYYRNAETLVCITPDMAEKVRAMGWTRPIEVIPNFTRAKPVAPIDRATMQTPDDASSRGDGPFRQAEGFDHLLRAVARTPGVWCASRDGTRGRGAEGSHCRTRNRRPGADARMAHRRIRLPLRRRCLRHHLPPRTLGNVCFEGWGAGKPTIAARAEARPSSWTLVRSPSWSPPEIVEELAAAIERVRADPDLRDHLIAGGRRKLETRFRKRRSHPPISISSAAAQAMRLMHFHFGKEGGAERFFVHLANAFARRVLSSAR